MSINYTTDWGWCYVLMLRGFVFVVLSCHQMTIGKIYCAKLIHENYKYLRRKNTPAERVSVKRNINGPCGGHVGRGQQVCHPKPRAETLKNDFLWDQTQRFCPSRFNMAAVWIVTCAYIDHKTKSFFLNI